jgi:hypothetical protein
MNYRVAPHPDIPDAFQLFHKETGELFNVGKKIEEDYKAGKCDNKVKL